jgi:hypothetical protein
VLFCVSEYKVYSSEVSAKGQEHVVDIAEGSTRVAVHDIAHIPLSIEAPKQSPLHLLPIEENEADEPLLRLPPPATEAIDYNDPAYNDFSFKEDRIKRGSGINGSPSGPAEDNVDHYLTARLALLCIRDLKPHLFTEPLPLLDKIILESTLYRNILAGKEGADPSDDVGSTLTTRLFRDPRRQAREILDRVDEEEDPEGLLDPELELKNAKMFDFLRRVRDSHAAINRHSRRKVYTTASVVVETDYIPPPAEGGEIALIPSRRRALKPVPLVRSPQTVQVERCNVLLQIVGAKNIPQRMLLKEDVTIKKGTLSAKKTEAVVEPDQTAVIDPLMLSDEIVSNRSGVSSFVEMHLQENKATTTCLEGMAPMWRQSVSLAFKNPEDDYSSAAMAQIRDSVTITIFDEVTEDDAHRGGFLEGESTLRIEKRFLGTISIPIRTIVSEGRIEGSFRVDAPLSNIGYSLKSQVNKRLAIKAGTMFIGGEENNPANNIQQSNAGWMPTFLKTLLQHTPEDISGTDYNEYITEAVQKEFGFFASGNAAIFISVMVTLDPLLPPPPSFFIRPIDKLPPISFVARVADGLGNEVALLAHARRWLTELMAIGPHTKKRGYVVFATNHMGHSVFIPRFLCTDMQIPAGFTSRRSLVHLVSLLPFMSDAQAFIGEADLWCTMKQTLDIGAGDEEEHAVMLFNLLTALSRDPGTDTAPLATAYPTDSIIAKESLFLVLGSALPEGATVYILLRDASKGTSGSMPLNFLVVNPCTGYVFSAADPQSPLRSIHTLVTPYNIFANIQLVDKPHELDFNILNTSKWKPFYGGRLSFPSLGLPTFQTKFEYKVTSTSYCLEVEDAIKNGIKLKMRQWRTRRKRSITTFHPDASSTVYDMLQLMENWKRNGTILTLLYPDNYYVIWLV